MRGERRIAQRSACGKDALDYHVQQALKLMHVNFFIYVYALYDSNSWV